MPVGLTEPVQLFPVDGIKLSACSAGIYKKKRLDLALLSITEGSTCAAVFTRNRFSAAPVEVARLHLNQNQPSHCIINAGNANAGTGAKGYKDALNVCQAVSRIAGCDSNSVLPFSTGVIGEFLPVDKICEKIPELISGLNRDNWLKVAKTIMTTDTVAKGVSKQITINKQKITVTGIAKGAGMIRPDMATMLAFIATDLLVESRDLSLLLSEAMAQSFNRINVDGDTSTNDACVLIATGKRKCDFNNYPEERLLFEKTVTEVCTELAQAIIRDAEGATKFITVQIRQGFDTDECLKVAYAIANSPLIKTAFYASDPNWGRILAAIGRAGISDLDIAKVSVFIDDVCIVQNGMRSADYSEQAGQRVMQHDEILLKVCLGRGDTEETIWTCDMSHEYVRINAEYRT